MAGNPVRHATSGRSCRVRGGILLTLVVLLDLPVSVSATPQQKETKERWARFVVMPLIGYGLGLPVEGWPRSHGVSGGVEPGMLLGNNMVGLAVSLMHLTPFGQASDIDSEHIVFHISAVYRYTFHLRERFFVRLGSGLGYGKTDGCYGSGDVCGPLGGLAVGLHAGAGIKVTRLVGIGYFCDVTWQLGGSNGLGPVAFNSHRVGILVPP